VPARSLLGQCDRGWYSRESRKHPSLALFLEFDMPVDELLLSSHMQYLLFEVDGCEGEKSLCVGGSGVTLVAIRSPKDVVEVCWFHRGRLLIFLSMNPDEGAREM